MYLWQCSTSRHNNNEASSHSPNPVANKLHSQLKGRGEQVQLREKKKIDGDSAVEEMVL